MMTRPYSYLLPTGKKHKRGDSNIRFVIFILVVAILLVAFLGQILRDYRREGIVEARLQQERSSSQQHTNHQNQSAATQYTNYPAAYPAAGVATGSYAQHQQSIYTQSTPTAPTGLPNQPVNVGTAGRVLSTQNAIDTLEDSRFLIQGSVQVVEARSISPVVICCLYGQGRTIRLAGVDEDVWRQGKASINRFLSDSIEHARSYYNGKMLFEVVSSEYDDFGDVYGYLYIPHEDGLWWHPSYQERFYQVNLQLLRQGFARYKPNQDYLYKRLFIEAEDVAKSENQGMWY